MEIGQAQSVSLDDEWDIGGSFVRVAQMRRREEGSVKLLVAITLPVIVAMAALVFDLGHLAAEKRVVVAVADAASLAAASACSRGESAVNAAAEVADANLASLEGDVVCGADQTVHVAVEKVVELSFAPIFGVNTGTVRAEATASWDSTGNLLADFGLVESAVMHP